MTKFWTTYILFLVCLFLGAVWAFETYADIPGPIVIEEHKPMEGCG